MGHCSQVTTTIEVTNQTAFQFPCRTDGHLGLVVTTEETTNLEGITAGIRETGVNVHLVLETIVG